MKIKDFYEAFHFLDDHPIFLDEWGGSHFNRCLDIFVVKVNPETGSIDDNDYLNTQVEIWLECGPYDPTMRQHDIDLDCGGKTFDQAIIKLANLVLEKYGDYQKE